MYIEIAGKHWTATCKTKCAVSFLLLRWLHCSAQEKQLLVRENLLKNTPEQEIPVYRDVTLCWWMSISLCFKDTTALQNIQQYSLNDTA